MGINEILDVVAFVKALGQKMEDVNADGKVTVVEVVAAMSGVVGPAFSAIKGLDQFSVQAKDLDALETQQLVNACMDAMTPYIRLLSGMK